MKIIATALLLMTAETAGAEDFHYTSVTEVRALMSGADGAPIAVLPMDQDRPKKKCHAKECAPAGPARDKEDAERGKRDMVHSHEGMYTRSLVSQAGAEVDCREFAVEECFVIGDDGKRKGFSFDYVRAEENGNIVWSVENVKGVKLAKPHRYVRAKKDAGVRFKYDGNPADEFKPHCAISRFNGWQEMMEERGGNKITISFLEYLVKQPE